MTTDPSDGSEADPTVRNPVPGGTAVPGGPGAPNGDTTDDPSEPPHSALVGYMSVPVHRRLPIRRSTLLMVVAFVGFGTLLYFNPAGASTSPSITRSAGGTTIHTADGDVFVPNATSVAPTTTTSTTTTTTTTPPRSTATSRPPGVTTTSSLPATGVAPNPTATTSTTTTTTASPAAGSGTGTTTTSSSAP